MPILTESLAGAGAGFLPYAATLALATVPVLELRAALPIALEVYRLPVWQAMLLSVAGNLLPVYVVLVFFERAAAWLRPRSPAADRWLTRLFARTRRRLSPKVERYGVWALALFVAVPLPATGAWTGSLAAFIFGFPKWQSFLSIAAGLAVAAVVVTAAVRGAASLVSWWPNA